MTTRSIPDDFTPPYPAYQSHPPDERTHLVLAMLGVQAPPTTPATSVVLSLLGTLGAERDGRPESVEIASHHDPQGHRVDLAMSYWASHDEMEAFFVRDDVRALLDVPRDDDIGIFVERLAAPVTSLDGNYARKDVRYGIARVSDVEEQQFHSYMGSMRDRVPDYLDGSADGAPLQLARVEAPSSRGQVRRASQLPDRLCFIRGAFAWEDAEPEEQRVFMEQMWPVYKEGAEYLSEHPIESNCISMRMVEDLKLGYDNGVQSEVLGWFVTLQDLERWTREHPRHLAILENIYSYMATFNFQPKLNLGHEVAVASADRVVAQYNNCDPETGFLPWFPSEPIAT